MRRSEAEWLEEMYIDIHYEQATVVEALRRVSSSGLEPRDQEIERERLRKEINRLAEVLQEPSPLPASDQALDSMDQALAAGEDVDLSALLPKGMKIREA